MYLVQCMTFYRFVLKCQINQIKIKQSSEIKLLIKLPYNDFKMSQTMLLVSFYAVNMLIEKLLYKQKCIPK